MEPIELVTVRLFDEPPMKSCQRLHLELTLNHLIDQYTIHGVLHALTDVCYGRSERLIHYMVHQIVMAIDVEQMQVRAEDWEATGRKISRLERGMGHTLQS